MILKLGEAGAITLLVSPQVIKEAEGALKRKASESIPLLAILLDRSGVTMADAAPRPSASALFAASIVQVNASSAPSWRLIRVVSEEAMIAPSMLATSIRSTDSCSQSASKASLASNASSCSRKRATAFALLSRFFSSAAITGSA